MKPFALEAVGCGYRVVDVDEASAALAKNEHTVDRRLSCLPIGIYSGMDDPDIRRCQAKADVAILSKRPPSVMACRALAVLDTITSSYQIPVDDSTIADEKMQTPV
ncbi:hypothetical protein OLZ32_22065 [Rhizobium sp. 1AS11]|jgi:hypothetical protein|uniref:hypothetical protein n=1 Tax=Rhizobium acaciae TaxID=2989736 RepID=UPI002222D1C0|nr:hypothetical protein [Rhizobium acaciae]MCW1411080.1 hypothetical protein [Rhizobium acaciae]MCW1743068.1 hypothetical protein [Rhizobium acaciae]